MDNNNIDNEMGEILARGINRSVAKNYRGNKWDSEEYRQRTIELQDAIMKAQAEGLKYGFDALKHYKEVLAVIEKQNEEEAAGQK